MKKKLIELQKRKNELYGEIRKAADADDFNKEGWDAVNADYDGVCEQLAAATRADELEAEQNATTDQRVDELRGQGHHVSKDQVEHETRITGEIENLALNGWARRGCNMSMPTDSAEAIKRFDAAQDSINFRMGQNRALLRQVGSSFETRAQATSPDSAGGFTIAEGFISQLEKRMLYFGPMQSVVFNLRTNKGNRLPMPTVDDTSNEGDVVAENAAIVEQDVTFGEVVFNAFKYSSKLVKVSRELMEDSEFDMSSLLSDLLGERLGRRTNKDLTIGTGSGQMQGAVTGATAGVTTAAVAAVTADELIDFNHSLDIAYRSQGAYMFNDATIQDIRKLKDLDDNYLWQSGLALGRPDTLLGAPVLANNDIAVQATGADFGLFGDFSKLWHRQVRDISVFVLNELFRANDQTGFVSFLRQDARVIQPQAIKKITNA